jgi:hypothetical protein
MKNVGGRIKILGVESLALNRILYIAPWREEACKYPDQATLSSGVPQEKGTSRSRFSVIITCDPENSGLYPDQPPLDENPAIEVSRPQSIRRQPPTYSTHRNSLNSNDKVSRETARRARRPLVGAGRKSATGRRIRLYSTNEPHIRTATHRASIQTTQVALYC